jgi:branched-chain amino acid transport system substrate-binding protein
VSLEQASSGEGLMLAARLAVVDGRGALARHGLVVEIVSFDDRATAAVGVSNARRIVADPAILAVIGPLSSDVALAVAEIYREAGLAMVSPSSTHPLLTDRGFPNVFRACGRDDVQADLAARFIKQSLGATSVYVVDDGTAYGRGNAEAFHASAARRQLTIVGATTATEEDVPGVVDLIKATAPDVLYFAGSYDIAAPLLMAGRRAGLTARFVGADGIDSPELVRRAGRAAEGVYYTSVAGGVGVHPQAKGFANDYRRKFAKDPEPFAAQAYDATAVLLEAIVRASKHGVPPSHQAVTAAIRDVRYMGVSGPIAFDQRGDLRRALYLVMKVSAREPDEWDDNRELKRFGLAPPAR